MTFWGRPDILDERMRLQYGAYFIEEAHSGRFLIGRVERTNVLDMGHLAKDLEERADRAFGKLGPRFVAALQILAGALR